MNPQRLTQALLRVFVAIVASFALLTLVLLAQQVVRQVDIGIAATFMGSAKQMGVAITSLGAGTAGVSLALGGWAPFILIGAIILLGVFILWAVLLMCTVLVYVGCFFAPLAMVISARAGKKMLELIVAMLLVPFVITSIMAIGLAIIGDGPNTAVTVAHFFEGGGLIFVAILAPFSLMKFMPIAESHISNLRNPGSTARSAHSTGSQIAGKGKSTSSAGGGGAGAAAGGADL
jgi:hypothetical protein